MLRLKLKLYRLLLVRYILNVLIGIDQLVNTIFGGDPDETISSRTYRYSTKGKLWARMLDKFLSLFEDQHCKKSYVKDEKLEWDLSVYKKTIEKELGIRKD